MKAVTRRKTATLLLASLLVAALGACSESLGPEPLSPEDVLGQWTLLSGECSWGEQTPAIDLTITRAEPTIAGRLNLEGNWDERGLGPSIAPSEGTFTGSVDRATGKLELMLWRLWMSGWLTGLFEGTIAKDNTAAGAMSWGYCQKKQGSRVSRS